MLLIGGMAIPLHQANAVTISTTVAAGSDDAEEASNGSMYLSSGDLELVTDGGVQTVGIRFPGVAIPKGATVTNAYIQFIVDRSSTAITSLTIAGQATDNAPSFTTASKNISSRARTAATTAWVPAAWSKAGTVGVDQRTPNLAATAQEIVSRPGWNQNNAMVFVITGSGVRTAKSFEGGGKPVLHVEYTQANQQNTAPVVTAGSDQTATVGDSTSTTNLPGTLTGVMPEGHGHLGPYTDTNGNVYTVIEDFLANGNSPMAMKSADGGQTWNEIDRAGRPTTGDLEGSWTVQVGTTIYFAWQKSSAHIYMAAYNTSDAPSNPDKWVIQRQEIHVPLTDPEEQYISMVARSNGDLVAFYATEAGSAGQQIGYKIRSAATGTWGPQTLLDTSKNTGQVVAERGANDTIHIFYKDHTNQHILYKSLSSSGVLSAARQVDTSGTHTIHSPMSNAVYYDAAGAERIVVAWANASKILKASVIENGIPSAEQTVSDVPVVINPGITDNIAAITHLAVDGTTVHALYADESTQDIWHDSSANGTGWGVDMEIDDDLTVQWLSGLNAYTNRTGQRVLGYIYDTSPHADDGGNIRYNELALSGAKPYAALNGTVTDDGLPTGSTVTSQWSQVSGPGTTTFSNPTAPITTASFSQAGEYTLRLTASDSGLSSSDDVIVTVSETANAAPVVKAGPDQTVTLPATTALNGTVTDDGLPTDSTVTSQWSQVSGPGTVTFTDATAPSTTASFSDAGTYVLRLTGNDSVSSTSDDVTITIRAEGSQQTFVKDFVLASGSDDAEEASGGSVYLSSSDLELVDDGGLQTVGLRFAGIAVPKGATVTNAYVQFTVDEATTGAASLTIAGQATDNALTFTTASKNISSRARTVTATAWNPASWLTVGAAGVDQRTPNLSGIVQEIVNRNGWTEGNALSFIVSGSGKRTAEAFEGTAKPVLRIEYTY